MTAEVNRKGVLDIDPVKGCSIGMAATGESGCYGACYAAATARFRGLDFTKSVVRRIQGPAHAKQIERAARSAPLGFFRMGTMGDPCHAWSETCETAEWLAPYATPVVVTKHWIRAGDDEFRRLIACGAVLNTSMSALDTPAQLTYREHQFRRYADMGGVSAARVVSCWFNLDDPLGAKLGAIQDRLLSLAPVIDNPLRVPRTHRLVQAGILRLKVVRDLADSRTISMANDTTYVGHCDACPDRCGLTFAPPHSARPHAPQGELFGGSWNEAA